MVENCFPEPGMTDDTWADHGESWVNWLGRSTLWRAAEVRRFVNENLTRLPTEYQEAYCRALHTRWTSGLFELVLARIVQLLEGKFVVEVENPEGRRPDLGVTFEDGRVVIEATAPEFDLDTAAQKSRHSHLLRIIESMIPETSSALISTLPDIGPSESKKPFRQALQQALEQRGEADERGWTRVAFTLPQGTLKLDLLPREMADGPIAGGPTYGLWSDAEHRIKRALASKRSQVRSEKDPVILAVLSSAIGASFSDFDHALFGRTAARVDRAGNVVERWFEANGYLARQSESPTYAGVLAMASLTPFRCSGPVLYIHGRPEELPRALSAFEQRILVPGEGVRIIEAERPDFMTQLNWVRMDP